MATRDASNTNLGGQTGSGNYVGSTSPTIATPSITDGTYNVLTFIANGVIANNWRMNGGQAAASPVLGVIGSDTNINAIIAPKGTGGVILYTGNLTTPFAIRSGTSNQHFASFVFTDAATSPNYTFPDANLTFVGTAAALTNGQIPIGNTGNLPTAATLTAGSGITITNAAGSITIASTTSGMTWTTVSGTTQSAAVNNGYITNNAGAVTVTLPTTFAIGDAVEVKGLGAGGWVLAAGAATTIRYGTSVTSAAGSLTSANQYDTVKITGLVANTTWSVDYALSAGLTVA
jgi:hypothetical protein